MKQRLIKGLKWTLIYTLTTFLFIEILLRILGYSPFYNTDYKVTANPKDAYVGDEQLGIRLNPGEYTITLNDSVPFKATHTERGYRLTPHSMLPERPDITFYGCSFTYGYGVNDQEPFPALFQAKYPELSIRNAAVSGYGTVQSMLQLEHDLKTHAPQLVLLNLSSFHFIRNTMAQQYRSNLRIGFRRSSNDVDERMVNSRFPYLNEQGSLHYVAWSDMYSNWPGRSWLSSINFLQSKYDNIIDDRLKPIEITVYAIEAMAKMCAQYQVKFAVICLDNSEETRHVQKQLNSLPWVNVNFDFKSKAYTHLPYDSHPNAAGHTYIFNRTTAFIDSLLNE